MENSKMTVSTVDLFVKYENSLRQYFLRHLGGDKVQDLYEVEDLTQEVFSRLIARGSALDLRRYSPRAYLCRTAQNTLTGFFRQKSRSTA